MAKSTVTASIAKIPSSKVTEIKMILSTEANKNKKIMLVEGADDMKFYSLFIDDTSIKINVLDSCYYMPDILMLSTADAVLKDKVIGIKDADYDHITRKAYTMNNLFLTDTHDWETMVMTEACECRVSMEGIERKEKTIFVQVMHHLENYSYIKLFNEIEVLSKGKDGIRFKGLTLSKIYDGENPCDLKKSLDAIKGHGNNSRLAHFPTEIDVDRIKHTYASVDLCQLTCGHDLIHGLVCRLTKLKGQSPKIGYNDIELIFRITCSLDTFKSTKLYQQVDLWAKVHKTTVWAA